MTSKRTEPLILANSFAEIITANRNNSRPLKVLWRAIERLAGTSYRNEVGSTVFGSYRSRSTWLLNPEQPGTHYAFREKKGLISYMPMGKTQEVVDGIWSLKGRQATKPGAWLRAVLHPKVIERCKIRDHEFSFLASLVKHEELKSELAFRLVSFEEGYRKSNYDPVIESCMWNGPVGEFYRTFGAECLICQDGTGKYRGRAVIWKNVRIVGREETITLMDRIYSDTEEVCLAMQKYADSQGWRRKYRQSRDSKEEIAAEFGSESRRLSVSAEDYPDVNFYPYLDTFSWGVGRKLMNWHHEDAEYFYDGNDGSRSDLSDPEEDMMEDIHGNMIPEDEAVEVAGEIYHQDDEAICRLENGRCALVEDCVEIGEYWYRRNSDEVVWSEPEDEYILYCYAVEVDGEWYSTDSTLIVQARPDLEWMLKEDCVEIKNEPWDPNSDEVVETVEGEYCLEKDAIEVDGYYYDPESPLIGKNEAGEWVEVIAHPKPVITDESQLEINLKGDA